MADAITLLRSDHRSVEKQFKAFEKAGPKALQARRRAVKAMIEELSVHAAIEEQVFYPAVRAEVPHLKGDVLESLEEHHIVKWVLSELQGMSPSAERFDAKVTVLIENVRHHVKEEEHDLFPAVRQALTRARLSELGDELQAAKGRAPKRPHPRGPDEPPLNVVAGAVADTVDRVVGSVKKAAKR